MAKRKPDKIKQSLIYIVTMFIAIGGFIWKIVLILFRSIANFYAWMASKLTPKVGKQKAWVILILSTILIVGGIIFGINLAINARNAEIQRQYEIQKAEEEARFPITVNIPKKINTLDVNSIIKNCITGSQNFNEALNQQIQTLNGAASEKKVQCFGDCIPEQSDVDNLSVQINNFLTKYNAPLHIVMFDLNTCSGLTYDADTYTPVASAIKLPYITSLLNYCPEIYEKEKANIENCLIWSDNESYFSLWGTYGTEYLRAWCSQLGISTDLGYIEFPDRVTARDMSLLWLRSFYFLHTAPFGNELCEMISRSKDSIFADIFSDKYVVHSKPGWWDGPDTTEFGEYYNGLRADCGVIHAYNNPYILIIYCEDYMSSSSLSEIINSIDKCHSSIFIKSIICNNQDELDEANEELNDTLNSEYNDKNSEDESSDN